MKGPIFFLLLLSTATFVGCSHDPKESFLFKEDVVENPTASDYLIFGHFYGECLGEGCIETYKLTADQLFEDTLDHYYGAGPFSFVPLDPAVFEEVKDLWDFFPAELLNQPDSTFGLPDAGDWGGLIVILFKDGQTHTWRLDQRNQSNPAYAQDFADKVNDKIYQINN